MLRSPLFRQFLLVSGLVAMVLVVFSVVIQEQLSAPQPDLGRIRMFRLIFTALIVALILFAGFAQVQIVASRLRRVLDGMQALQRGEYPRLRVDGSDELAELVRGFNQTVEELRKRDERLKGLVGQRDTRVVELSRTLEEERERLEAVLESIGDAVVVLDSENKVLMGNRHVSDIFGVPMEALQSANLSMLVEQVRHRLVNPDKLQEQLRQLQQDPSSVNEILMELDQPGGPAIRLYCAPVRGADGKVFGRIATALDLGKERELERLKGEFLSTVSHELRTPLTSIKGALGLIRAGTAGTVSADMRELLDIAVLNTDRLIRVINNILDIFQLERGQARVRPVTMLLSQSVERAVGAVAAQAEHGGIAVEIRLPENLPAVRGDPTRVEQVLVNLLSNAIKFSPRGQKVIVSARAEDEAVCISVQDFGHGIGKEFRERLFRKFEHAEDALTRESQGAGLGLAICRHIVDQHGGRIWVESEEGRGSTFHFTVPVADRQPAAAAASEKAGRRRPMQPRLILVIDDDEDVSRVISYVFESQGHRVIIAQSGREAIELARRHRPDMLTLDLVMPDMDGYSVLRALRGQEETRKIPIICISFRPDSGAALSQGANYYLEKPVDIDELQEIAERVLASL
jgi:PAS domain S-box-containing protein